MQEKIRRSGASPKRVIQSSPPSPIINNNTEDPWMLIRASREGAMNTEQILSNYRNGDLDKRLRLFLTYRDLRSQFVAIEDENEKRAGSFVLRAGPRYKRNRFSCW